MLADRPLSVIRVHRGQEAFMQKNVPKYTPDWVRTVQLLGGGLEARRLLRAVQRPPHVALVRQPAGGRVPPDAGARRSARPRRRISCSTSTRPRPTRSRMAVRGGPPGPPGAGRRRAGGRGEDQRRQGPARVRARSTTAPAGRRGRRDPSHRRAGRAPRSRRSRRRRS